ncbi:TIGR02099 family protein [Oryzisolibacter propanilivorax]|uniref:TIGR02099 family protein n=1 Tax=Oryzisolibacter propanilivorax TaxID=1527607 RepID=A0A1G9Q7D5_9BURK|nr:YhdP family protein [Oryzisolibacter propanilivorax]SDM06958.1 TIGR02099 family protein [Oryzisolibacter propanilivorax]
MPELPLHPSRPLKILSVCARWALGLTVAAWLVLAAAWAVLHGWIVPRADSLRPHLERQATRALGVPVRIAAMTAHGGSVFPTIELTGVALLDAAGRPGLQLPRVVVALSPRSLLRFGFEQVYIEAPELDVRRARDGRVFVAGMAFRSSGEDDSRAADWLFSQPEVAIRGGTLRFSDELRDAPPLALTQVDLVLRNRGWRHAVRLDATPQPEWGERFTLRGQFRQPLLSRHDGRWQQWSGQLYAHFPRADVSRLHRHVDLGALAVARGMGGVRAWGDVRRGQLIGGTVDLALAEVDATLGEGLQPLVLRQVTGRAGGRWLEGGFEFSANDLQFTAADGLHWPGGQLLLRLVDGGAPQAEGELRADRLDLAALAQVAARLPLGPALHQALHDYAPAGRVEGLVAQWRGPLAAPREYQARARVHGLELAARGAATRIPGLVGADVQLELTQVGGRAVLGMKNGQLVLPGVFEDPVVPVAHLATTVHWQVEKNGRIAVQAPEVRFGNADAEGQAKIAWNTADPGADGQGARFPGVLELSGSLARADGTRVHRYLPLAVPESARHYVRDAVTAGSASGVKFSVKGDLHHFPYAHGEPGEFRITAPVKGVEYAYVPPALLHPGDKAWPALSGLSGELVFDRASMTVRNAAGSLAGAPRLRVQRTGARIADLEHPVVEVDGQIAGPLADMLAVVRDSQVAQLTHGALDAASASGGAELRLGLRLPIADLAHSGVRGSVQLAGNDVRFVPEAPLVAGARGAVQFTEGGFTLAGVQGRALGGPVSLEGGMRSLPGAEPQVRVQARGTASAEGLREAGPWQALTQLAAHASGSTPYALEIGVRRGLAELLVTSDLVGLALAAPPPLAKDAATPLPLRFERRLTAASAASASAPREDELLVGLGELARLHWVRALDEAGHARVLRGAIGVGEAAREPPTLPASGVVANAVFGHFDADAWLALLGGGDAPASGAPAGDAVPAYLPDSVGLRADTLEAGGRALHRVVAGASRQGQVWRANVDAAELNGYVEYRPGAGSDAGLVHARLARLTLPEAAQEEVNELLPESAQPQTLPALDIAVQDFVLRGRRMGRLEIEARNRVASDGEREWQLARFNLAAPEAQLASSGRWALAAGARERRTALDFRLDVRDSGALLARFGMDGVLQRGQGRLDGRIGWTGSPIAPDWRSMDGQLHLDMQSGQFLKADPGLAKLLSVLSLQSLPRRLTLDFRDVFSQGFAFDFVRGDVRIERGIATTNNLQMKGVNAAVLMEGSADIERETQDLRVVVVPEINALTASLVATAINPVIGLSSFLAQVFLRGPLMQAATQEFRIDGTWADPQVQRVARRRSPAPASTADAAKPATVPLSKEQP